MVVGPKEEWNSTSGQPSRLYRAAFYYIFNATIWFISLLGYTRREAVSAIFASCKRLQRKSLTVVRQPVLALISPASDSIHYSYRQLGAGGPFIYTVEPQVQQSKTTQEILYIHGGGCISGDFAGYKGFCERLANEMNTRVHFVAYRLAPESDICDAVNDVLQAHELIVGAGAGASAGTGAAAAAAAVSWMADSGGGTIALNAMSRLLSQQGATSCPPIPSKCILLSPVTDLHCSGESFRNNAAADAILNADVTRWALWLACRDSSKDPSPIVQHFPNCDISSNQKPEFYFYVGAKEILLDDSVRMANKLKTAGYTVNLEVNPWGFHSWPLLWRYVPEADQTVKDICAMLSTQI